MRDPADETVLEAAVNGQANAIVTFNLRDYGSAPKDFGIEVLLPRNALKRLLWCLTGKANRGRSAIFCR